ncbi:MAG: endopeptidase La [Bacteroidia bacterium]|nr:endopeptidase La [Bacteroidia bacterium]MDW8347497.1 endopeptidase La [Bacteroidia bacterium]
MRSLSVAPSVSVVRNSPTRSAARDTPKVNIFILNTTSLYADFLFSRYNKKQIFILILLKKLTFAALIFSLMPKKSVTDASQKTDKSSKRKSKAGYVIPTLDTVILPGTSYPLLVGRDFSANAVNIVHEVKNHIRLILVPEFSKEHKKEDEASLGDIIDLIFNRKIGVSAKIEHLATLPSGLYKVVVQALERVEATNFNYTAEQVITAQYESLPIINDITPKEDKAYISTIKDLFEQYTSIQEPSAQLDYKVNQPDFKPSCENEFIVYQIAHILPLSIETKYELLQKSNLSEQYNLIIQFLQNEIEIGKIKREIQQKLEKGVEKSQRRYYIQEQLRVLQEEFDEENVNPEISKLRHLIDKAGMPEKAIQKCNDELDKLKRIPPMSPEYGVIVNYVELLTNLPWSKMGQDNLGLLHAQEVLNAHHYGLEKVKERILEYIAVLNNSGNPKGQILCLVGPPGVGKTSLGRSIAEALNKKYVRIALGGIADEAEIRGHRRTYIGSMPGRIINAMKRAGVINPLIVLDEIDKLGKDYKGDPAAALLEVLDPEQNHAFNDHFVEIDYDLSHVFFIATANVETDIPVALRDRMEIIHLEGYTENEKIHIAHKFLIPKQCKENGLSTQDIIFDTSAVLKIINEYTAEAGVRNLEHKIGSIVRKVVRKHLEAKEKQENILPVRITDNDVEQYLGALRVREVPKWNEDKIGVVYGLAWTSTGGRLLPIECTICEGESKIYFTGQMGNIMKESAQTAYTFLKAHATDWGIPAEAFKNKEIHIHLPEGAIPKDGPSAGISLFTVLYSVFTQKPVRNDVALTGEITLTGQILPIGGLTEKILAAKRNQIYNVLIPSDNADILKEINPEILEGMNIIQIKHASEVLGYLFR